MLDIIEQDYFRVLSAAQEVKIYVEIGSNAPGDGDKALYKDLISHAIKRDFRDLLENKYGIYTIVARDIVLRDGITFDTLADMVLAVKTVADFAEVRDDLKRDSSALSRDLAEIVKWNLRRIGRFDVETRMRIATPEPRFSYLDVLYYFPPLNRWALAALVAALLLSYLFYRQTTVASPVLPPPTPVIDTPRSPPSIAPQTRAEGELPPLPAVNPLRESRREIRCHSCRDCRPGRAYDRSYVYEEPTPFQRCDHW